MLLHLEMMKCSKEILPQSAERELTIRGYEYIRKKLPISRVGHDGKEIKDMTVVLPDVADDLDPWHFKKLEMNHFNEHCVNETKCIMGNKKLGITSDSKEIKKQKMRCRKHLLTIKQGLGFHLLQSCKWSKQSEHVAMMLWSSYILHYLGCHTFFFDDEIGIGSIGKSSCAKKAYSAKIYDKEEYQILCNYIFNPCIKEALP